MLPFPSYYYELQSTSNGDNEYLQQQGFSSMEMKNNVEGSSARDSKAIAACKSHSEAERRRRQRINSHLTTLRSLLPNKTKTDKASLLGEVIEHVKELKRVADDMVVTWEDGDGCNSSNSSRDTVTEWRESLLPGEIDELTLGYVNDDTEKSTKSTLIRASFCCDDRTELLTDLTQALRSVRVRVVKAEMATVGGRTKSVVVMEKRKSDGGGRGGGGGGGGGGSGGGGNEDDLGALRRTLKAVLLEQPAMSASGLVLPGNKRPRLSRQSSPYYQ